MCFENTTKWAVTPGKQTNKQDAYLIGSRHDANHALTLAIPFAHTNTENEEFASVKCYFADRTRHFHIKSRPLALLFIRTCTLGVNRKGLRFEFHSWRSSLLI
jgi:hypothetical protein